MVQQTIIDTDYRLQITAVFIFCSTVLTKAINAQYFMENQI